MPTWGTFDWGAANYGADTTHAPAVETALFSRPPAGVDTVAQGTATRRTTTAKVYSFDLETWTVGDPLPFIAPGAGEQYTLVQDRYSDLTLSFAVQHPDRYLDRLDLAPLIAPGAALIVVREVTDQTGAGYIRTSPPYVIQTPPSRDDDFQGGNGLSITAIDRLQYYRSQTINATGFLYLKGLWDVFEQALELGLTPEMYADEGLDPNAAWYDSWATPPDHKSTFLQFLTAWLYTKLGAGLRWAWDGRRSEDMTTYWWAAFKPPYSGLEVQAAQKWAGSDEDVPEETPVQISLGEQGWVPIGNAGSRLTFGDALNWLWGGAPFRLSWTRDGFAMLRPAQQEYNSGWAAVREPSALAHFYVPWESMALQLGDPSVRAVLYQLTFTPPPPPPRSKSIHAGGGGGSVEVIVKTPEQLAEDARQAQRNVGAAYSTNARFPFRPEFDVAQSIVERDLVQQARGFGATDLSYYPGTHIPLTPNAVGGFDDFCRYTLDLALGAAERITLVVDSAIDPPELGMALLVVNRRKGIDGTYRLTSVSRPLDLGAATWMLDWVRDGR
jgi:hypothetical protein